MDTLTPHNDMTARMPRINSVANMIHLKRLPKSIKSPGFTGQPGLNG